MYGWRGTVGLVKPTFRPGPLEAFIRLLPEGVCAVPRYVGIRGGTEKEFQEALAIAEQRVGELAALKVDVVLLQGAPPFMLLGPEFDRENSRKLEAKHGVPVLSATMIQLDALKALGAKSLVGLTYFQDDLNPKFGQFFEHAGFKVVAMKGIDVPFADVGKVPVEVIYGAAKKLFQQSGGADCLYLLGAGWDCLKAIAPLERDLNTTVLTNVPADVWATLKFLAIREPIHGFGRLLEELP
jgi:maleate cis-trans isomerase